jgi:exopolyphosphatase/guanosine-5'-triphosphate,3'-diphosphate pyrophosphatase
VTVTPPTSAPTAGTARAAIDIGTNSFHLVVARFSEGSRFEVIAREKEAVRLGHGSGEMRHIEPEAMQRGIDTLARFRRIADAHGAPITAVATSAVREAANRDEFLRRARDEAGVTVQVISGVEEARLIHLGVLQAVPVYDRLHLVFDIGGGSTEFVVAKETQVHLARSIKLGAIRLTDRFFPDGEVLGRAVADCREYVRAYLTPLAREIEPWGFEVAIGSAGTVNAVAAMIEYQRGRRGEIRSVNNARFTRTELGELIELVMSARTPSERLARVPGLDAKRADIIVGGIILLEQILETLGIHELVVSEYALREGVLLDIRHEDSIDLHHLDDIRRVGVQALVERFERDRPHVLHATDLALQLFDQLQPSHQLETADRDELEAAGALHNVGLFISHSAHHKHSYYVIRNSDGLVGFTDREIEIMALVARYHRKSDPSPKHLEFAHLSPHDQRVVRVLAGLLRIGIALDRSHVGLVRHVTTHVSDHRIRIEATVEPDADISLELYTAGQRKALLERTLGAAIEIVAITAAAPATDATGESSPAGID